ncbi:hypothetical protein Tsubulata_021050 [Turnera subulata]|uniref:MYND-type domain-containing protein n=1 Tax=Turnera subulata TaxID=218843 RepID=A0A9Q0FPF4_9ROSI|nr:hypothetical protein Tsubulata_021050 [Turnera subulata]
MDRRKRPRISRKPTTKSDLFDQLPDDLVVSILIRLTSSSTSPSDFINLLITCKRFNRLGLTPQVLAKAGPKTFAIKAKNWSPSVHRFLKLCVDAGNPEASYTLGMIRFYCLQNRGSGASLMAKAAIKSHAPALYSLSVIQFNGSGGSKSDKDLRAGVALCARAAVLGHVDALRELGHCLQDGYGVPQNVAEGRRFLIQANARELLTSSPPPPPSMLTCQLLEQKHPHPPQLLHAAAAASHYYAAMCAIMGSTATAGSPLLSDFGCNVPAREVHPANRFLSEWFGSGRGVLGDGLRLCSHSGCGRPETRLHEFRRCSVCGKVNYCSRGCQALDWKLRHKGECVPMEQWNGELNGAIGGMVEIEGAEDVANGHW